MEHCLAPDVLAGADQRGELALLARSCLRLRFRFLFAMKEVVGMLVDFGLVLPPWNFSHAAGNLLDRVVGEVGIDHLTVAAITGPMVQYRLGAEFDAPYFYTEGGWHFSPQAKLYAATGVRPHAARWAGSRDTLGPMREYASKHGLKFILRINCRGLQRPLASLPETRMRTAWGGELAGYGACTSSPVFRELVQAAVADLQSYEPDGFELDRVRSGEEELQLGVPRPLLWEGLLKYWVRTCFCPACRQTATRAGVDVSAAVRVVQNFGHEYARAGFTPELNQKLESLGPYWDARRADLDHWIEHIAATVAPRTVYAVGEPLAKGLVRRLERDERYDARDEGGRDQAPPSLHESNGSSFAPIGFAESDPARLAAGSEPAPITGLIWNLFAPNAQAGDSLVRSLSHAVGLGFQFFEFERVEEMPEQAVTWLKQAVRYARRQGEGS